MNTRRILMVITGLGALALAGCSPKNDTPPPPPPATTADNAVDRAAQTAREAAAQAGDTLTNTWNNVKDATYDERARFQASIDNLASSVDAKIDELRARGETVPEKTKESWNKGLEQLRAARADLRREMADIGSATAETWDQAKADVASAWERVRQSYSNLESQRTN